jgi:hypothetical protein
MVVILCHPDDDAALWLHGMLSALGNTSAELVAVEQLVFSRGIVHRLSDAGETGSIQLVDGRTLRPSTITGIVNRVRYLPTQHFANASPVDRAYATAELSAFLLAWLNGIGGRVINPARPFALGGGALQPIALLHHAATAGLPTAAWTGSTMPIQSQVPAPIIPTHVATVLDGRVFGRLMPRDLQDGCRRLAVLTGIPLLQVQLHESLDEGWRFVGATGTVDFRLGGRPLAAAIAKALAG